MLSAACCHCFHLKLCFVRIFKSEMEKTEVLCCVPGPIKLQNAFNALNCFFFQMLCLYVAAMRPYLLFH